jgi:IS5 family transposase
MQAGLFDIDDCYTRLDKAGDPLVALTKSIDWSGLSELMKTIKFECQDNGNKGGRRPLDGLMMAKILILQSYNNLSDENCEFLINDRMSFKRFLDLRFNQKSPDAKAIWLWRERIKHSNLHEKIFSWFEGQLTKAGFVANEGQIIDATFVPTHKPSGKHKKQLKEGFELTSAQASQVDPDATFTKKAGKHHHGYKNHIQIDNKYKLIRKAEATTASMHDSQKFDDLLANNNLSKDVWGDSAYRSTKTEVDLTAQGFTSHINERAYRNKPLTLEQKLANHKRAKVRARGEHPFAFMNNSMGGLMIHTMTLARAKVKIIFKNLVYNMWRFAYLQKCKARQLMITT